MKVVGKSPLVEGVQGKTRYEELSPEIEGWLTRTITEGIISRRLNHMAKMKLLGLDIPKVSGKQKEQADEYLLNTEQLGTPAKEHMYYTEFITNMRIVDDLKFRGIEIKKDIIIKGYDKFMELGDPYEIMVYAAKMKLLGIPVQIDAKKYSKNCRLRLEDMIKGEFIVGFCEMTAAMKDLEAPQNEVMKKYEKKIRAELMKIKKGETDSPEPAVEYMRILIALKKYDMLTPTKNDKNILPALKDYR